jgi:hypothetical protein
VCVHLDGFAEEGGAGDGQERPRIALSRVRRQGEGPQVMHGDSLCYNRVTLLSPKMNTKIRIFGLIRNFFFLFLFWKKVTKKVSYKKTFFV